MNLYRWNEIRTEELNPTARRKVIHTDGMTIARLYLQQGATVPRHHHPNEQVTNLESGRLRFIFDDNEVIVDAGESLVIPPDVPHRVEAIVDSVALDLFTPPREDWISGNDAYLRGPATPPESSTR